MTDSNPATAIVLIDVIVVLLDLDAGTFEARASAVTQPSGARSFECEVLAESCIPSTDA
jgi:hypothetical protein